jgi:hypothetical protein
MGRAKVPVSERALIQRINRKLGPEGKMLKVARSRAESFVGRHYILDIKRSWIVAQHCDPEALGRKLGVLAEWEGVNGNGA